ncbi:MAG: transcriptional regulator NrdR [Elusimicrobiota bacterium]|nr:transcriptional regulator NrdR [Elusimicrobiota bacterium]
MRCPFCSSFNGQVVDSRHVENSSAIRRRRLCLDCKKRWTTFERPEELSIMVIKSNNRREPYNRAKLREGIIRACQKRPVSAEIIDKLVLETENEIFSEYIMEIPSQIIGEKVLGKLYAIDAVAYIRFASVYRKFDDIDDFIDEIQKFKKGGS